MDQPAPDIYPVAAQDPATAVALRRMRRGAVVGVLLSVAMLAGAYVCAATAGRQAADLLRTGMRVPGLVTSTWSGSKGQPFMAVTYQVNGRRYTEPVAIDSSGPHQCGTVLTVVADPADPAQMRTLTDANESRGLTLAAIMLFAFGLVAALTSAALAPATRSTRRRCEQARWVPVERTQPMKWRKMRGVTLCGDQVDVVVTPARTPLMPPLWALSDAAPGRSVVLRWQRDGRWGGPVRLGGLKAWSADKVAEATQGNLGVQSGDLPQRQRDKCQ